MKKAKPRNKAPETPESRLRKRKRLRLFIIALLLVTGYIANSVYQTNRKVTPMTMEQAGAIARLTAMKDPLGRFPAAYVEDIHFDESGTWIVRVTSRDPALPAAYGGFYFIVAVDPETRRGEIRGGGP